MNIFYPFYAIGFFYTLYIRTKLHVFSICLAGFRPSETARLSVTSPKDPNWGKSKYNITLMQK